jgi:hypothetical protein
VYHIFEYMALRFDIELEPEVREWLDTLSVSDYRTVEYHADRLAEAPTLLGEPYSKHLMGAGGAADMSGSARNGNAHL